MKNKPNSDCLAIYMATNAIEKKSTTSSHQECIDQRSWLIFHLVFILLAYGASGIASVDQFIALVLCRLASKIRVNATCFIQLRL